MFFDSYISEEKLKTVAIELINNSDSNFVIASTLSKGNGWKIFRGYSC